MRYYALAIVCVLGISIGQILFKETADNIKSFGYFDVQTMRPFIFSVVLYFLTTLLWVFVLRFIPLAMAYPLMALAYLFVPLMLMLFKNESMSQTYWVGVLMIVLGVFITSKSA